MARMTLTLAQIEAMGGAFVDDIPPRVILPNDISAVVGDTLQLFRRGIIEAPDPYCRATTMVCDEGADFPRYFEWTPGAPDAGTTQTLTVSVQDVNQTVIAVATTDLVVNTAADPASMKTIMCVGDSITNGVVWPTEAYRRLTQSGGTPAGLGFSNFQFIGEQALTGFPTQGAFGRSGWNWLMYTTDATSPFVTGGVFSIKTWVDANGGNAPDLVIAYLGTAGAYALSADPAAQSTWITYAKVFADKLHAEYPSAQLVIFGVLCPSPLGGAGTSYGATAPWYDTWRWSNGLNLAYKAWAAEEAYSSWMRFVSTAAQFDADTMYPATDVAVNTRNTSTESRQTDVVHPSTDGRKQIADVAFREIVRAFA